MSELFHLLELQGFLRKATRTTIYVLDVPTHCFTSLLVNHNHNISNNNHNNENWPNIMLRFFSDSCVMDLTCILQGYTKDWIRF